MKLHKHNLKNRCGVNTAGRKAQRKQRGLKDENTKKKL